MSVYGYGRETTPTLERLAGNGTLFTNAFCQVPDTTPSHASMLTGRYPFVHGAANGIPLGDDLPVLGAVLRSRGMRTGAFVSGWTLTAEACGLARGFDTYDDTMTVAGTETARQPNERLAAQTTEQALEWLGQSEDDPYFLFVHYFDPHGRYLPPAPYDSMFPPARPGARRLPLDSIPAYARIGRETDVDVYIGMYDGEIRYVDDQIARLLEAIEARGELEETLVVVTADHGESLTEHGMIFSHGFRLFDPSLRVPLIVSSPGFLPKGGRVESLARTVDLAPTILDAVAGAAEGADAPDDWLPDGESLLGAIRGEADDRSFIIAKTTKSLTYRQTKIDRAVHDHYAIRTERFKYLHSEDGKTRFLFDLGADPAEMRDVVKERGEEAERLRGVLDHVLESADVAAEPFLGAMDEAERAQLRERLEALGYIR